jgi:hypothetical protein
VGQLSQGFYETTRKFSDKLILAYVWVEMKQSGRSFLWLVHTKISKNLWSIGGWIRYAGEE